MLIQKLRGKTNVLTKGEFSRSSLAWGEKGIVFPNEPRLYDIEPAGYCRRGIMVEEGAMNLLGPRSDISLWSNYQDSTALVTPNQPDPFGGLTAVRVQGTRASAGPLVYYVTLGASAADKVYSWGIWIKTLSKPVVLNTSLGGVLGELPAWSDWTYISRENYPGNGTTHVQIQFRAVDPETEIDLLACQPQIEDKPFLSTFTPNIRDPEALFIPRTVVNPQEGTIDVWVEITPKTKRLGGTNRVFDIRREVLATTTLGIYLAHRDDSGYWLYRTYSDANSYSNVQIPDSLTPDGWHLFTCVWSVDEMALYIDGVLQGTQANPKLPSGFGSDLSIGRYGAGSSFLNAVFGPIRVSNVARSASEAQATYQAGFAMPADEYTTYKLDFSDDVVIKRRKSLVL